MIYQRNKQYVALLLFACMLVQLCGRPIFPPFLAIRGGKTVADEIAAVTESSSDETAIDMDLYSRQLLVYGKQAQSQLQNAHVLVQGTGALAMEIIKNLVMAGVGEITITYDESGQYNGSTTSTNTLSLLGAADSAWEYARQLNTYVRVHAQPFSVLNNITAIKQMNVTLAVLPDYALQQLRPVADELHVNGVKLVAASVQGNSGYVFNDFGPNFAVRDVDGDPVHEVPLRSCSIINNNSSNASFDATASHLLRVTVIDEEQLQVSSGAKVQILTSAAEHADVIDCQVAKVETTKSCVLQCQTAAQVQNARILIGTGKAIIRTVKATAVLHHDPLSLQLLWPTFTACNACLATKKQRAISLLLLACMKAGEQLQLLQQQQQQRRKVRVVDTPTFTTMVEEELRLLGVNQALHQLEQQLKLKQPDSLLMIAQYHRSCAGQCSASVSVVGAIAAQEAIKAITHQYMPLHQWLMFESLDALLDLTALTASLNLSVVKSKSSSSARIDGMSHRHAKTANHTTKSRHNTAPATASVRVYGTEVAAELQRMRVFVVGAGAIGCELLKNFALLGVGCRRPFKRTRHRRNRRNSAINDRSSNASSSAWSFLKARDGGVVVTDNDHIEKSNLNRQLLFRSEHIGLSKSLVAAQQSQKLNSLFNVVGLDIRLDDSSTSQRVFDAKFWQTTDVVVTALDNVDARLYADAQCVRRGKWLLDSGTLGTKGNTQAVIPQVSQSYASSADPPDNAVPICTLKSFPYQSEHCIAWAKNLFDRLFGADVARLRTLSDLLASSSVSNNTNTGDSDTDDDGDVVGRIREWLNSQNTEDLQALRSNTNFLVQALQTFSAGEEAVVLDGALKWALGLFQSLYEGEIQQLLRENPPNKLDDEGQPFWGGSRRIPKPMLLTNIVGSRDAHSHFSMLVDFVTNAARLLVQTTTGRTVSMHALQQRLDIIVQSLNAKTTIFDTDVVSNDDMIAQVLSNVQLLNARGVQWKVLQTIEFEKDNLALGHVSFVAAASNLRCAVYSLQPSDVMQVQKVAGNIVPALATTTAIVAGLVTHELVKIAGENVLRRKLRAKLKQQRGRGTSTGVSNSTKAEDKPVKSSLSEIYRRLGAAMRSSKTDKSTLTSTTTAGSGDSDTVFSVVHSKTRLLGRFRNAFVNLATATFTFAQPVEAESYAVSGSEEFNLWSFIEAPDSLEHLTVRQLARHLSDRYGVRLQSLALDDWLLYADFLPVEDSASEDSDAAAVDEEDEDMSVPNRRILACMESVLPSELLNDDNVTDNSSSVSHDRLLKWLSGRDFIELHALCEREDDDSDNTSDDRSVKLPPIRAYVGSMAFVERQTNEGGATATTATTATAVNDVDTETDIDDAIIVDTDLDSADHTTTDSNSDNQRHEDSLFGRAVQKLKKLANKE